MLATVLSILLLLLKIIGIILLVLLGIILLILFVPVFYGFEAICPEDKKITGHFRASWFGFLLRFRMDYENNVLIYKLSLPAYILKSNDPDYLKKQEEKAKAAKKKKSKKKAKEKEEDFEEDFSLDQEEDSVQLEENIREEEIPKEATSQEATSQETIPEAGIEEDMEYPESSYNPTRQPTIFEEDQKTHKAKAIENKKKDKDKNKDKKNNKKKAKNKEEGKKESKLAAVQEKYEELRKKLDEGKSFMDEYQVISLVSIATKNLIRLLKHILPRKLWGRLHYGFDDPALTGKVTGYIAMFYPLYRNSLQVEPEFWETCFEGNLKGKGRVQLAYLLWIILLLLLKKEVRKIIKYFLD